MNLLPKEHGATVMFAASLAAGWGLAGWRVDRLSVAMAVALAMALMMREPVVTLGRRWGVFTPRQRAVAGGWALAALALHLAAVTVLLGSPLPKPTLALLAVVGASAWIDAAVATIRRQDWHWWNDLLGAASAAVAAPAMMLGASGEMGRAAAQGWALVALFLVGGTFHLRVVLRNGPRFRDPKTAPHGRAALWSVASVAAAAALVGLGALPAGPAAATTVALLRPLLLRGAVLDRLPRIGLAESALTALFVAALVG